MQNKPQHLSDLSAIVGGLLISMGIVMLGASMLSLFGFLDVGMLLESKYVLFFAVSVFAIGLLDVFSAVVISRWLD